MSFAEYIASQPQNFYFFLVYYSVIACFGIVLVFPLHSARQNLLAYLFIVPTLVGAILFVDFKNAEANNFQPIKYKYAVGAFPDDEREAQRKVYF